MKSDDIIIAEKFIIYTINQGNKDIAISGVLTLNKGFECFQVFTYDYKCYLFSLTNDEIEDNDEISDDLMNRINSTLESIGGRKEIIRLIQEKYNSKIFNENIPEPEYRDELGKGNIIEYCIY